MGTAQGMAILKLKAKLAKLAASRHDNIELLSRVLNDTLPPASRALPCARNTATMEAIRPCVFLLRTTSPLSEHAKANLSDDLLCTSPFRVEVHTLSGGYYRQFSDRCALSTLPSGGHRLHACRTSGYPDWSPHLASPLGKRMRAAGSCSRFLESI